MSAMLASDAARLCGGKLYGADYKICRNWRCDSRDIGFDDAFVAMKGEKSDGHFYVHEAVERGAKMLLVDEKEVSRLELDTQNYKGVSTIAAKDPLKALTQIAQEYLKRVAPHTVGITGSVGKTTTRELAVAALSKKYKVHSAIRSFNTAVGCSLVVLGMPEDTQMLVLEFGTNHFGEIAEMTQLFPPETALITEIAPAHLEGFGTISGVLDAKLEIYSPNVKYVVYNADNLLLSDALASRVPAERLLPVGYGEDAQLKIESIKTVLDENGARVHAAYSTDSGNFECEAALFGKQQAYNIGFALATARLYGVKDAEIGEALAGLSPIKGRGVCKKVAHNSWIIDEAYNANPSSMRVALENLYAVSQNRKKIAVLGGMRELGKDSGYWHKEILLLAKNCDKIFLTGSEWNAKELPANAQFYAKFEDLAHAVCSQEISNATVLIKGSNSYGLKRLVAILTEV